MVESNTNNSQKLQPVKANERGCVSIADFLNANKHLLEQENEK